MKFVFYLPLGFVCLSHATAATNIEWGSLVGSSIVDSNGQTLDSSYVFQLGSFQGSFIPTSENTNEWASTWTVFDQAVYNAEFGYFTSIGGVNGDGTSNSSYADMIEPTAFSGGTAYIWVYNTQTIGEGTEWFLASAPEWIFPTGNDDCCDPSLPTQWSMSDLDNGDVTPLWGSQTGQVGDGVYSVTNSSFDLQTFTFIPEPSSALLVALTACVFTLRRKRDH